MVRVPVAGCWVPVRVGTNARLMSPKAFSFQQQHLERPWGQPGLSLPSDLTGTLCPSLAEAAGGPRWCQLYGVQGPLVHPSPRASVSLQDKKPFWCPCLALTLLLVPPTGFPAS